MAILNTIARLAPPSTDGTIRPWAAWMVKKPIGALCRVAFRPSVAGWEHIPAEGGCLLVANHSGGGLADVLVLAEAWLRQHGAERPVAGMAHPLVMIVPGLRDLFAALGAIPSTREAAEKALGEGRAVLVFPGGDHESFRPIWQAGRVDMAGRKGFLKLARTCQVPIVPIGISGSHYTLPILWRSELLPRLLVVPRLLGVKRFPITLTGVVTGAAAFAAVLPVLGVPGGVVAAVLCVASPVSWFLPVVPWSIKVKIGEAIPPEALFPDDDLAAPYVRVEGAVQRLVDELRGVVQGTTASRRTSTPEVTLQNPLKPVHASSSKVPVP